MAYDPTIGMLDIHDPVAMEEYTRAGQAEYKAARKQHSSSDNWNAEQYHAAAGFVPKLAGKVLEWVELKPGDRVLDIGCGGAYSYLPLLRYS